MESKYKIIFNIKENLYMENAPVVIKAGALVQNTENSNLHIQLKFQNIVNKTISMLKVRITLMDIVGRLLGQTENQYLDLNCSRNKLCGSNIPVRIKENATRKFSVQVMEVCFSDGSIWEGNDAEWGGNTKSVFS